MTKSLTLEDLLGPFFMADRATPASEGGIILSISRMLGGGQRQITDPKRPGIVPSSFGYELGYLVNLSFFPGDTFSYGQKALIDWSDKQNKDVHLGVSRDMGGPYEDHTNDMNRIYFGLASNAGVAVDPKIVIAINLHDYFEDHKDIIGLYDQFKDIHSQAKEVGLRKEPVGSQNLREEIRRKRVEIGRTLLDKQSEFIASLNLREGITPKDRENLTAEGTFAVGVVDHLTRRIEREFFFQSVYHMQFRRSLKNYLNDKLGMPLQVSVMESLGRKGLEPMEGLLGRLAVKGWDRIGISKERKPRFTRFQSRELEKLVKSDPVLVDMYGNQRRLSEIYGNIRFRAEAMPMSYNLNILFRNVVVLQNMHLAINRYGQQIARQKNKNPAAYEYMQILLATRQALVAESNHIVQDLRRFYEKELPRASVEGEQTAVTKNLRDYPTHFEEITGEGPITRGARLDTVYKDRWKELDVRKQKENYRDVLEFEVLFGNFSDPRKNIFDLEPGTAVFNMFTIKGLTDKLKVVDFDPRPYEREI